MSGERVEDIGRGRVAFHGYGFDPTGEGVAKDEHRVESVMGLGHVSYVAYHRVEGISANGRAGRSGVAIVFSPCEGALVALGDVFVNVGVHARPVVAVAQGMEGAFLTLMAKAIVESVEVRGA